MGNYDSVRELVGAFKVLASLMVALDGPIARLSKHWFVLNVLRVGSVLRSLYLASNQLRWLILNVVDY